MFNSNRQSLRLIRLRQAAAAAMRGRPPFSVPVQLSLAVQTGPHGDTDHLISGVYNGIQAATSTTRLNIMWGAPEHAAYHPRRCIIVTDDELIVGGRQDILEEPAGGVTNWWYAVAVATMEEPPDLPGWWKELVYGRAENLRALRR